MPNRSDRVVFQADPDFIISNCAEFPKAGNYICCFAIVPIGLLSQTRWRDADDCDLGARLSAAAFGACASCLPEARPH